MKVFLLLQSNLFITDTQGDRNKCPYYRGVRFREVGFIWISVSQGPSELSVIERCPYYRGVRKERFHCNSWWKLDTRDPISGILREY